jgi:hypothetical protein
VSCGKNYAPRSDYIPVWFFFSHVAGCRCDGMPPHRAIAGGGVACNRTTYSRTYSKTKDCTFGDRRATAGFYVLSKVPADLRADRVRRPGGNSTYLSRAMESGALAKGARFAARADGGARPRHRSHLYYDAGAAYDIMPWALSSAALCAVPGTSVVRRISRPQSALLHTVARSMSSRVTRVRYSIR